MKDNSLTLEIVNIEFSNTAVLALAVWVFLLWLIFRYWLMNRHLIEDQINQELHGKSYGLRIFKDQMRKKMALNEGDTLLNLKFKRCVNDDNVSSLHISDYTWQVEDWDYIPDEERGDIMSPNVRDGIFLRIVLFFALIRLSVTYPSLTGYYIPYLLSFSAIGFGLCNEMAAIAPFFEWLCGIFH